MYVCPSCGAPTDGRSEMCGRCARPMPLGQGIVLAGRYEILGHLGRGGMGSVYKVHDRLLNETIAIKTLRPDIAASPDMAQRFLSEIKLARRIGHKNVCRIFEYGDDGPLRFIAMEFIEGIDLRKLIQQNGPFTGGAGLEVALQIAAGLEAIHDVGVIHRDLKTANLMRDPRGVIKLMDFGIAKEWGAEGTTNVTATGTALGTPEYMSPEQAEGEKVDFRSDVYAFGIVLFELYTGDVPFRGTTPMATALKHIHQPPPLDGPRASPIPAPLVPILRGALAKRPEERQQSMQDMIEALRSAKAALPAEPTGQARRQTSPAVRVTPLPKPSLTAAPTTPAPSRPAPPPKPVPPAPPVTPPAKPVPTPLPKVTAPAPLPKPTPAPLPKAAPSTPLPKPAPVAPPPKPVTPPPPPKPVPTPAQPAPPPPKAATPAPAKPAAPAPMPAKPAPPEPPAPPPAAPRPAPTPASVAPEPDRRGLPQPVIWGAGVAVAVALGIGVVIAIVNLAPFKPLSPSTPTPIPEGPSAASTSTPTQARPSTPAPMPRVAANMPAPTATPAPAARPTPMPAASQRPTPAPRTARPTPSAPPRPTPVPPPRPTPRLALATPTPLPVVPPPAPTPEVKEPGELRVIVKPWADVAVDGAPVGTAPVSKSLPPGRHTVRLTHTDYRPLVKIVEVRAGQTTRLVVNMADEAFPIDKNK